MSARSYFFARIVPMVLLFTIVGYAGARAQAGKYGFVVTDNIIKALPEISEIDKKLTTMQTAVTDTVRMLQSNLQTRLEAYQRQQGTMTAESKAKEEEALRGMDQQLAQYREDRSQMLQQMQDKLMQPLRERVRSAIERVAKEEKFSAIMDRGAFLYVDDKLDLTYKVLDYLKRGN